MIRNLNVRLAEDEGREDARGETGHRAEGRRSGSASSVARAPPPAAGSPCQPSPWGSPSP